jgi:uncharacterized protein (TIGR02231 family)
MADDIRQAVVYLNGAQITRARTFKLKSGANKVLFNDLPLNVSGQSITASSDGKCVVVSVEHSVVYAKAGDKRISELYGKLEGLRHELDTANGMMSVLKEEENLIRKNTQTPDGRIFRSDDMKEAVRFFRERMSSLCSEKLESQKKIRSLSDEINKIQSAIGIDDRERRRSQVEIEVHCKNDAESELMISYFIQEARWDPYYDIRVKDVSSPLSIASKATVYQSTGEDWNNVNMVLSTGNPTLGGDLPDLLPWYIDFYEPQTAMRAREGNFQAWNLKRAETVEEEVCEMAVCAPAVAEDVRITVPAESMTSVEYALPAPYTVMSSDSGRSVDILTHELKAEYVYKSIRKMEKDVFLLAGVKEWEHLNLLAGTANVFFEDKYVGECRIDPRKTEEGLRIPLGRDKNVIVTRVRGKDYTAPSVIGSTTKVSREWTLTARNLRKQKIDMVIEDQIPVSMNKGITVDAVNISGAEHDKETGKLTWKFTLDPAGSKTLPVKYAVSYPKSRTVILE